MTCHCCCFLGVGQCQEEGQYQEEGQLAVLPLLSLSLLLLMSSMGSAGQWRRSLVRVVRINLAAAIIKLQIAVVVASIVVVVVVAWHLLLLLSPFVCLVSPRVASSRLVCAEGRSSIGLFGDDE